MKKPIACDLHDHFEIVCMRNSNIQLTLMDGQVVEGQALDIATIDKIEFIKLVTHANQIIEIALTNIRTLSAINNRQSQHNFTVEITRNAAI